MKMLFPSCFVATLSVFQLWLMILASASPAKRVWVVRRDVQNITETNPQKEPEVQNSTPRIYSMEIVSDIRLRYASTKVTSKVVNPASKAQEATFHVVLPDTAFISGFLMEIDGKVYKASVKEKEKAQTEYQNAVDAGQSAAQVTANARDANQFTVSVNIEPQAKMLFNLTYEELLTRRRGIYEHAIHVTPGSVVPKMSVQVNIFETLSINKITIPQLRGNDVEPTDNSTENTIAKIIRTNETVVSVVYEPSEAQQVNISKDGLEGQFVVQYDVDRSSIERKGGEIHVVDGYFVHFFAPTTLPSLPKHVIFVLDTSGSMAGKRIEQTKQAMNSILDQLRDGDLFSVVEFSSDVTEWDLSKPYKGPEPYYFRAPADLSTQGTIEVQQTNGSEIEERFGPYDDIFSYPVTERSVKRAKEFVAVMEVTSSTNINDALLLALKNSQSVQSRLRLTPIIIFLTDGEPTSGVVDKTEILANVRKGNNDNVVSIFCLAFGSDTDYDFLTKVSSQNRGFARKIYEAADATLQLKGFFEEVASPLLSNVRFIYNNNGPVHDVTETKVANFFNGTEFVVAGRLDHNSNLSASIIGTGANGSFSFPEIITIKRPCIAGGCIDLKNVTKKESTKNFSLEKIWAYMTIQDMLKKRQVIDDAKSIAQFNEKALNLSLSYDFVTPLTSLIVVKPNSTSSAADLRPADAQTNGFHGAYSIAATPVKPGKNPKPPSRPLPVPIFFATPQAPKPSRFKPSRPVPITTTFRPHFRPTTPTFKPETMGTTEVVAETELPKTLDSVSFDPLKWIDQFQHNETHVKIQFGNHSLELLWQNEQQSDKGPDFCSKSPPYHVICKSIWKCENYMRGITSFFNSSAVDAKAACVIDNIYVGVCCDETASTSSP